MCALWVCDSCSNTDECRCVEVCLSFLSLWHRPRNTGFSLATDTNAAAASAFAGSRCRRHCWWSSTSLSAQCWLMSDLSYFNHTVHGSVHSMFLPQRTLLVLVDFGMRFCLVSSVFKTYCWHCSIPCLIWMIRIGCLNVTILWYKNSEVYNLCLSLRLTSNCKTSSIFKNVIWTPYNYLYCLTAQTLNYDCLVCLLQFTVNQPNNHFVCSHPRMLDGRLDLKAHWSKSPQSWKISRVETQKTPACPRTKVFILKSLH